MGGRFSFDSKHLPSQKLSPSLSSCSTKCRQQIRPLPMSMQEKERKPKVAVVGAGWGGWGAAKALCEMGCEVLLLDGMEDPTGSKPLLTPTGKPFEAGTRGFWKDYPNIENLLSELGIAEDEAFTQFTGSSFYSPFGLEATAPVFSSSSLPQLPSPLGQVFATFTNFKRIPVSDRTTMLGLLYSILDFDRSEKTFEAYDRMTAHELFIRMGVSKRLVDDFIRPTLLVGLFKPPEELSAAVAMELLYFYALAHQTSFDVRWIKKQSISEVLINPLANMLIEKHGLEIRSKSFVKEILVDKAAKKVTGITLKGKDGQEETIENLDACVLALGAKGMKYLMAGSPALAKIAPELSRASSLGSIDVIATRIWLDRYVVTENPANVLSKFEGLRGAGGTFFLLDQLQPDQRALWGGEEPQGSVLACDFYNAGGLLPLSEQDIIDLLMKELLPAVVPEFGRANVVDSYVQKYPGAVTWFSPGSYTSRPPLKTSLSNLVCAGDWVRMGDREHGAKGLCQERAYVSGLEAANALGNEGVLGRERKFRSHRVIPIREDEPQVVLGRVANKQVMDILAKFNLDSPWVR
ncbi:hypothetical protein GUITHDRAFT_89689 [Guillardia theta CCMP2712]|uniref:Amine oxidase domain-containing protein n=3 Tax=Guillardia theta TaxID=55529 RepID=L1IM33_GUITC|nr:hypothetical protein GUITHDRAFT_89689 [Guillardia theta CCMP2712]EKX37328.1 hypothetical protein GUITHDRAFT_89689 [Guillardia theta CCMP2712]|eukprot:XP_005824308.1 hypothetical protein GUITHDRAFT_89689 [Guillardia theta CCMP2712]